MTAKLRDGRKLPIFIHSIIDDMTAITPNAMRVYMHLARRADKAGCAWPSYQSIADHCFSSVSQNKSTRRTFARKAIDELLEAGLIVKENRKGEKGNSSNVYTLIDPMPISTGGDPMLNKHTPMPISTPLCLIGTKDTPAEDTPIEDTPSSSTTVTANTAPAPGPGPDDDDKANTAKLSELLQKAGVGISALTFEKYADLAAEVGYPAVFAAIDTAHGNSKQHTFAYVAKCARNNTRGVDGRTPKPAPVAATAAHTLFGD